MSEQVVSAIQRLDALEWFNAGDWLLYYPIGLLMVFLICLMIVFLCMLAGLLAFMSAREKTFKNYCRIVLELADGVVLWLFFVHYLVSVHSLLFYLMVNYV